MPYLVHGGLAGFLILHPGKGIIQLFDFIHGFCQQGFMRVALRILRERLRLRGLVPGSLCQFRLHGLQIHQGLLQVGREQPFLFQARKGFHQFPGNLLHFRHLGGNLRLLLGRGAGQFQLPFSEVHQFFTHLFDRFHGVRRSGLVRHLVQRRRNFMHAGNAFLGQGKMGVLGKCGGRHADGSAQADERNCFIHDGKAFPVRKNTFSPFSRQWRLLSRPLNRTI